MNDDVIDFISATVSDKPVAAVKAFSAAIEPKIQDALNAKREEIAQQIFSSETGETE